MKIRVLLRTYVHNLIIISQIQENTQTHKYAEDFNSQRLIYLIDKNE